MENLIINSKIKIHTGLFFNTVPRAGLTNVPYIGHIATTALRYGQDVDKTLKIDSILRQITNYKRLAFLRVRDNFSTEFANAFSKKHPVSIHLEFSASKQPNSIALFLDISALEIDFYTPNFSGELHIHKNFPALTNANGFEKIGVKFSSETVSNITYHKTSGD